jgi:hypothetical protein
MPKALTPSQTKEFIINHLMIKEWPAVMGPPGIGKSELVFEVGEEFDLKVLDIRLSSYLPEDMTGLPVVNDKTGKASYNPFDTFPLEGDPIPNGYSGWLIFLDEITSASEEMMAAIYSLLLGHTVGGKKVHPKAVIVAAGNRSTDSAIARPLPDTLISRMAVCEMKASAKDWIKWAESPRADKIRHESVISFIKKYPDMLVSQVDPKTREENEPFHSPRGWGRMMKIVNLHESQSKKNVVTKKDAAGIPVPVANKGKPITPAINAMFISASGTLAATAFKEHYDDAMQLPFPWEIAQSPSSSKIPTSMAGKAELTTNLVEHFIESSETSRDAILQYMNRMDPEYTALFSETLREKLGGTATDQRLVESVNKRLGVTGIAPDKLDDDEDDDDGLIPFANASPQRANPFGSKPSVRSIPDDL